MISDSTSLIPTEGREVGRRELLLLHTRQADYLSTGLNTLAKPHYSRVCIPKVCVCVVYVWARLHETELSVTI